MRKLAEPNRRNVLALCIGGLALPSLQRLAWGQSSWPNKAIRIVVPYPPGGQTDGLARAFGDFLSRQLGQPVVIENKAGGGGVIGIVDVKRSAADGYTLLCTTSSPLIQNRITVKNLPYDPEKDFIYLSSVSGAGGPVAVAPKTGANNLQEFIAYAKKVGRINWGSYGVGSTPHMLIETLARQYDLKFSVVQYRGEAPMWADVASGSIEGAVGSYGAVAPLVEAGKLNLIASLGDRLPPFKSTATMLEQGAVGQFYETRAFTTFAVPTGTPADIVTKLSGSLVKAGEDPLVKKLLSTFLLGQPASFEATNQRFKRDSEIVLGLLRELNIQAE